MNISQEEFIKLWNEGTSTEIMAEMAGLKNRKSVRDKASDLRCAGYPIVNRNEEKINGAAQLIDIEKARNIKADWRSLLKHCESSQDIRKRTKIGKLERFVFIDSSDPVLVLFSSDFHCGGYATDYTELLSLLEFVFKHNIRIAVIGDFVESFVTPRQSGYACYSQVLDPETQFKVMHDVLSELYEKELLLFFVSGCHEQKAERVVGMDIVELVFHNTKIPYMPDGGLIKLKVGNITYEILAKHKLLRESSINITNANRAAYNSIYPADIIVSAHKHTPSIQTVWRHGKKVLYIKTGTMNTGMDRYSTRYWTKGEAIMPCAVFFPDRKKMVGFDDIRDGIKMLGVKT